MSNQWTGSSTLEPVSEVKQRADFDIRWKVALGIEEEDRPFAKSTLQLFRAHQFSQLAKRQVHQHRSQPQTV